MLVPPQSIQSCNLKTFKKACLSALAARIVKKKEGKSVPSPSGRKVLKPKISLLYPRNRFFTRSMTPGVLILSYNTRKGRIRTNLRANGGLIKQSLHCWIKYLRLGFEIFHDIQEFVVDLRLVGELHFDLKKWKGIEKAKLLSPLDSLDQFIVRGSMTLGTFPAQELPDPSTGEHLRL